MASVVNINRLTPYLKQRIIQLHVSGVNQVQIVTRLQHEDNVKVSRQTVNSTIKKQRKIDSGILTCTNKRGLIPHLYEVHLNYISMCLKENGELSANKFCVKL